MGLELKGGIWHWRKMIRGHKFHESTKTGDRKQAEMIATLLEAKAIENVLIKGIVPKPLHEVMAAFLEARQGTPGYRIAVTHFKYLKTLPNVVINEVPTLGPNSPQAIVEARRLKGHSQNTYRVTAVYWNAVVRFAQEKKWLEKDDRLMLEIPDQIKTRTRVLTADEEQRLLNSVDPNGSYNRKCALKDEFRQVNQDLIVCLLDLAARYNEVARMQWGQVDLEHRTVLVNRLKGGNAATLLMTDRLYEVLKRRQAQATDEWVFPTKRVHNNNTHWMKAALKRAGISTDGGTITSHTMRHTQATRLLKAGLNLVEVKEFLGHNNIQSTMQYAHVQVSAMAEKALRLMQPEKKESEPD